VTDKGPAVTNPLLWYAIVPLVIGLIVLAILSALRFFDSE